MSRSVNAIEARKVGEEKIIIKKEKINLKKFLKKEEEDKSVLQIRIT